MAVHYYSVDLIEEKALEGLNTQQTTSEPLFVSAVSERRSTGSPCCFACRIFELLERKLSANRKVGLLILDIFLTLQISPI